MNPDHSRRCLLLDGSPAEEQLLAALDELTPISSGDLDALVAAGEPVDVVVLGSGAAAGVSLVQHVHLLLPDAGIAVLTDDVATVRRQVSFVPGVPLDLLVGAADEDFVEHVRQLRDTRQARRRHSAVPAAASLHASEPAGGASSAQTAVGSLLEHAPIAVLVATPTGELLGWNRRAEALLDLHPVMSGRPVDDAVPGSHALLTTASSEPTAAGGAGVPLQLRIADRVDVELSAVRTRTDQGRSVVLFLAVDVTARRVAEQERDRLAGQVRLLARVSEALMQSLDLKVSLERLAEALVPELADWVSIAARGENNLVYDNVVHHRDPERIGVAREVELFKARSNSFSEPSRLAADGTTVLLPDVTDEDMPAQVPDPELRELIAELGMGSALAVPIPGRVGLHGSLLLTRVPGGGRYTETDLPLAIEIGRRAGLALDNARLYAGQRHVATELQRSLLTDPPLLPYAEIEVRYVAAAEEAHVGGDWYDAFRGADGRLMVVIGDVVGHDTRAAASMGQVRGLLRGISYTTAADPACVLSAVDRAIEGLELPTMATVVAAQLTPGAAGIGVSWSNAGHPPPILLDADGRARYLTPSSGKADLLLGIDPGARRATETATLPPGSTLLLYTDGLVERRGATIDDGMDALLAAVEAHAAEDLGRFCDAIVSSMIASAGEDDVALVAVRPRPTAVIGGPA